VVSARRLLRQLREKLDEIRESDGDDFDPTEDAIVEKIWELMDANAEVRGRVLARYV